MKMKMKQLPMTCLLLLHLTSMIISGHASQIGKLNKLLMSSRRSNPAHRSQQHVGLDVEEDDDVYVGSQVGSMEADKIDALPGQPEGVDFNQYAGYVTVDAKAGRSLFYYFVESPHNSSSKPLVLWLNGGPGCSSFGIGAMGELGPFRVNSDGASLYRNDYAWNNVANVLFLESPAGVGFSYSNKSSDYVTVGDKRTAKDSYKFLINWLERFPHYKTRDFFMTGESYAGHYIPQLAYTIVVQNKVEDTPKINLKGVAIGNAYLDDNSTMWGMFDFLWSHAMLSDETYSGMHKYCDFTEDNSFDECQFMVQNFYTDVFGKIDIYNIYAPNCARDASSQTKSHLVPSNPNKGFDPCSIYYIISYLNRPEVQAALHVKPTIWEPCSEIGWTDQPKTIQPVIVKLLTESDISLWLYSGDIDSVVSVTASKYFLNSLSLPVKTKWRPWYSGDKEVGGYVTGYKGLTFATVRGAGHEVPSYQPERALTLLSSFLNGKLPPSAA